MKTENIQEEVSHDMENLRKIKRNRSSIHNGSPLQKTRINRRQNLRTVR
jgi:hypothetical protein